VVHIGAHRYIVVDECSGLAYVTLAGFLGYCFGLLLHGSFRRAAGMALIGALLGVLSNVIRVNAIVLGDDQRFVDALQKSDLAAREPGRLPARLRHLVRSWSLRYTASRYHRPGMAYCVLEMLRKRGANL